MYSGQTYQYTVEAFIGDISSGKPSNVYQVEVDPDSASITTSGLDTSVYATTQLLFQGRNINNQRMGSFATITANTTVHWRDLYWDTSYRTNVNIQPTNGQICVSTPNFDAWAYSAGVDVTAHVSCLTPATLEAETDSVTIQKGSVSQSGSPLTLRRQSDGQRMTSKAYSYESSNESVVKVGEFGFLEGIGAGEATIRVVANPEFYGDDVLVRRF